MERRGIQGEPIKQPVMLKLIAMEHAGMRRAKMARIMKVAPATIAKYFGPKREREE